MKRLLIALLSLGPFLCVAQSNYLKGYIITNSKEKLEGFVDFEGGPFSASEIRFKKELSQDPSNFYS